VEELSIKIAIAIVSVLATAPVAWAVKVAVDRRGIDAVVRELKEVNTNVGEMKTQLSLIQQEVGHVVTDLKRNEKEHDNFSSRLISLEKEIEILKVRG